METRWIYEALDNVKAETGIVGQWIAMDKKAEKLDGKLIFVIDNQEIRLNVEIRNEIRNYQLPEILNQAGKYDKYIVVAQNIFPALKKTLRNKGIAYLEANGNFFLKQGGAYILTDGKKPLKPAKKRAAPVFTKTALRLIFEILLDENIIHQPYRELAEKAKIGLGNVHNIMNELKEWGFLKKANKEDLKLNRKNELMEKWVAGYPEKLKPTLSMGHFRFLKEEDFNKWATNIKLKPMKTWWGGEPGGDLLTHYLRPARLILYTLENREDLIRNHKLIPEENGKVEIYNRFWHESHAGEKVVPPLLVYADLINTGDQRCIETAKKVYDEYLADKF